MSDLVIPDLKAFPRMWEEHAFGEWIAIERLVYSINHDFHPHHVRRWLATPVAEWPPIHVHDVLAKGYVHDGRHRIEAAKHLGMRRVAARVLEGLTLRGSRL